MKTWPDIGSSFSAVSQPVEAVAHVGDAGNQPDSGT
ncbi:UNVERIFIED_ORG: hypothetical protein J2Y78_004936 [Buttiauxella agrestis ATCC 33320]